MFNEYPKVLIVCTTPFSPNNQARAMDTYFHNWPKERLAQIFSNSQVPQKGICESLYRITDSELLYNLCHKNKKNGTIFRYADLPDDSIDTHDRLNRFKKKTWLRFYLRKLLWGRKRWLFNKMEKWVQEFSPDIIFCGLSDDFFILDITYYFAKKYNIPIVVSIGDDYYFAKRSNLLLKPYFSSYKKMFNMIMNTPGFAIYISDKIASKYNGFFEKQGFPVYLSSDITRTDGLRIKYEFNYYGNLELGRSYSLARLGDILFSIDNTFCVNVYSNDISKKNRLLLTKHHCFVNQGINYDLVKKKMNNGSFNVIASGFRKKDINLARYSLSTKVSDCLASSGPIIAIGPTGDGAIDYLSQRDCAVIINSKKADSDIIKRQILDLDFLKHIVSNAATVYKLEHNIEKNRLKFEQNCFKIVLGNKNE